MVTTNYPLQEISYEQYAIDWQDSMREFVPEKMGAGELILYWIVEIILYIPRLIANALCDHYIKPLIEQRSSITEFFQNRMRGSPFNIKLINIELPDGRKVKATLHQDKNGDDNTPIIIRFPGMGEMQQNGAIHDLVSSDHPLHFVTFDYPGMGENKDWAISKENTLLISLSIYAHLTNNLHIPHDQIHFFGFSLGGAIALQVEKRLPEHTGQVFCDRTFSSLFDIMYAKFGLLLGTILYLAAWFLGQDLPSKETLASLPSGKVHILNIKDEEDEAISKAASLFEAHVKNSSIDLHELSLEPLYKYDYHHTSSLRNFQVIGNSQTAYNYIHQQLT